MYVIFVGMHVITTYIMIDIYVYMYSINTWNVLHLKILNLKYRISSPL
jgi:hypothetical protein